MTEREDPLVGFHFAVDIQGVVKGYFTECSGLGSEHEVIERKAVNRDGQKVIHKIPGRLKWGNIVLKRGLTGSPDLWDWRKQVEDGKLKNARRSGSITLLNESHQPVMRWTFREAWPVKITLLPAGADGSEIAIEELTIAYEHITRES